MGQLPVISNFRVPVYACPSDPKSDRARDTGTNGIFLLRHVMDSILGPGLYTTCKRMPEVMAFVFRIRESAWADITDE